MEKACAISGLSFAFIHTNVSVISVTARDV